MSTKKLHLYIFYTFFTLSHFNRIIIKLIKRFDTNTSIAYATFIFKANSRIPIPMVSIILQKKMFINLK